jgi:Lar family restriction alleviation protein
MTDTARLSPCPHCGNAPQPVPQNTSVPLAFGYTQFIWCEHCNARGPERDTAEEAIAAWNRRPLLDELDASKARIAEVEGALRKLVTAVENMRVPQNIGEAAIQIEFTIGPAVKFARDTLPPPHGDAK